MDILSLRFLCAPLFALALGCASDPQAVASPDASSVVDAGVADVAVPLDANDAAADAAQDAPAACTDLANDGAVVRPTVVDAALPVGSGGVVAPGRYALAAVRYYGAGLPISPSETWQEIARFDGSRYAIVFRRNGGVETRVAGTLAFSGVTITTTGTCPVADVARDAQYRAEGDTLVIIDAKDARVLEFQRTGP